MYPKYNINFIDFDNLLQQSLSAGVFISKHWNEHAVCLWFQWEQGDFIISDNLAVGHEATPETQFPVSEVGLRILHRTTVKGTEKPSKS